VISRYGWGGGLRFGHVCESVTVTSLFTTLEVLSEQCAALSRPGCSAMRGRCPVRRDSVLIFEY
jgi:hypothetical protein